VLIIIAGVDKMKKEEEQMRKFIEETFSSQQKANTANKA